MQNKPQGCGASVASAAGLFTTRKTLVHIYLTTLRHVLYLEGGEWLSSCTSWFTPPPWEGASSNRRVGGRIFPRAGLAGYFIHPLWEPNSCFAAHILFIILTELSCIMYELAKFRICLHLFRLENSFNVMVIAIVSLRLWPPSPVSSSGSDNIARYNSADKQ